MNLVPGTQRVTADIAIGTSGKPIRVFCVNLISTTTASTITFYNGISAAGTAFEQIDGIASQSLTKNYAGGLRFPSGCFVDVDANISYMTVVYSEEF